MKDPIFWSLTIWYQIDQCHFAYTAESLHGSVLKLKLWVFWLKQAYSQPATNCRLMEGKLSIRTLSFNDNAIVRDFCPEKFHSSKLFKDLPPTWREFAYDHLRLWNHAQPKWSISKFLANKLNVADHFHAFLPVKVDLNPANIEAEDS